MNVSEFEKQPVLGILRGVKEEMIEPLAECVDSSGLKSLEITMNTEDAPNLIKKMVKASGGRFSVGAGTVTSIGQLEEALNAGATFIVMPIIEKDIVVYCVENNIPVFPGALTPNEIFHAWHLGATMVKVFPAKSFGPGYFKEVKAPLNNVKLMATGGVTIENVHEFVQNGVDAVSFGAGIFKMDLMEKGRYDIIRNDISMLINNFNNERSEA